MVISQTQISQTKKSQIKKSQKSIYQMQISRMYGYIERIYPEQRYLECGSMPNIFNNPGPNSPLLGPYLGPRDTLGPKSVSTCITQVPTARRRH
jgi:hypothetical protein